MLVLVPSQIALGYLSYRDVYAVAVIDERV
jgi:hypothetical protein